jgi:HEAT repeat protein
MLNKYICELVTRMLDNSDYETIVPYNSSLSISFKAHREAETLSDPKYIDNIIDNISNEKKPKRRGAMYFIIGRIIEHNYYEPGMLFLINRLDFETNKYIVSAMLDRIADTHKPSHLDLTKIFKCLKHKDWQVRFSAITALSKTENPLVDDFVIAILEDPKKTRIHQELALTVIYNVGTLKCLPTVEKLSKSKSRILKEQAKEVLKTLKEKFTIK